MPQQEIEEPVIVASWWKNRGREAIRVRLLTYEDHNIVDVRPGGRSWTPFGELFPKTVAATGAGRSARRSIFSQGQGGS
jgi:hypothetical protein